MKIIRILSYIVIASTLLLSPLHAESVTVSGIQLVGLERIESGTVFTYLPIKVGDQFEEKDARRIIRELYQTGLFADVAVRIDVTVLYVVLKERPGIASIDIEGNEDIPDEALTDSLRDIGVTPGRVFNRSILERLENELLQQYFARGKYSVKIDTQITPLPRNRVDIDINIVEGEIARIRQVNVVGNTVFEDDDIIDQFDSGKLRWYKFWDGRDNYAKPKLAGDLEKLRSQYLDNGYLKFAVDSTQVSITPDKKDIYITINVDEGEQYTVSETKLAGTFVVPEEELSNLLLIEQGQTFSRAQVVTSSERVTDRLGIEGYAFARVNPVPDIDEEAKTVSITFFVDPGPRTYVRRIEIRGNENTLDEVFRREFRQMEGGWYNKALVEASRARVRRLAYVESAEIQTVRVPGREDLVDLRVVIKERLAGNFSLGAGLSDGQGLVLSTSISQDNFLGTGKSMSLRVNTSQVNKVFSISHNNPYHTLDGVSRGFSLAYSATDTDDDSDISDFDSEQFGLNLRYGIPLTEVDRVSFTGGLSKTEVGTTSSTPTEIFDFIDDNDDEYLGYSLSAAFIHDTRDRRIFGTRGNLQRATAEVSMPGSDLEYYKLGYENILLVPLTDIFTLSLEGNLGYGAEYGSTTDLPFFVKYRAGGERTVRGYESNSLGPRDSNDDAFGGNFLTAARAEVLFPPPLLEDFAESMRLSAFVDTGNVFEEVGDFEVDELRGSLGVGVNWLTGLGGISFSLATPFNDQDGDDTEFFQFNLGTSF